MKKYLKKGLILAISLLLLLSGCIEDVPEQPQEGVELVHYYLTTSYTYALPLEEELLKTGFDPAYLVLANKQWALGADYVPSNLTDIPTSLCGGKDIQLEGRALYALKMMMAEMREAGITDTWVTSAYRSYSYQEHLFNYYMQLESSKISSDAYAFLGGDYIERNYTSLGKTKLSWEDAQRVVLSYSAYPGTSEHQSGLCVDFITSSMGELNTSFETYPAFAWLSQNAYRFGFVLRYPKDKTGITGYSYEPWHYRFVGREAATDMYFGGLTLEEYLTAMQQ